MRGYVIQKKGRADWQDVPVPEVGPYDTLVRPTAVATCTTDVHLIDALSLPNALGKVIGHEAVGVVDTVGDLVADFAPGDRVVLPAGLADWRHPRAQRGEAKFHQSKSPYFSDDPTNGGWFSELVKCFDADSNLAHIPDGVTEVQAVSVDDMAAAMRMTKFGGHVSVVSGFFDDETVTLPMSVWNYGVMEKHLTAAQANQGRDYMERLLLLIANGKLDTAPLASHVLHGWDKVGDSLELMRSRDQTVVKPVVLID